MEITWYFENNLVIAKDVDGKRIFSLSADEQHGPGMATALNHFKPISQAILTANGLMPSAGTS